jgi:Family of unknown function (DUF5996)
MNAWPALPLNEWEDTYRTLQLWTQIVGKVRLTLTPLINHWWNASLYVSARGLTTSAIPHGTDSFAIDFDFIDHRVLIRTSQGRQESWKLEPQTVAEFYRRFMAALRSLGIDITINTKPQELPNPIPFEQDQQHSSYDPEYANRLWRILLSTHMVLTEFRSRFIGKCSPVHLFWGSFDLACTRFSGRPAPPRKGVISREAYSHEVISAGFWPGGGPIQGAAFYAYSAPVPEGLSESRIKPAAGFWSKDLSEFLLMYDEVRTSASPRDTLLDFCQSTYDAGANLAKWDRTALER